MKQADTFEQMTETGIRHKNTTLLDISLSPVMAMGTAHVQQDICDRDVDSFTVSPEQVPAEQERVERAMVEAAAELRDSVARIEAALDPASAAIFQAHRQILQDSGLKDEIRHEIAKHRINAEDAVQRTFRRWEQSFRSKGSEIPQERAADLRDIGRLLLRNLAGLKLHSLEAIPERSVLVARRLLPSVTIFFPRRKVAAVLTEHGGPGSHPALLTRQIGIPGVCSDPQLLERVASGDEVAVDGLRGTVLIAPDETRRAQFRAEMERYRTSLAVAMRRRHEPAVTRDGVRIPVFANIGSRADAELAVENGAEGVGLFRIELLFLTHETLPSEEKLHEELRQAIEPVTGRPMVIRLLDIGSDKQLPYLRHPLEANPSLGQRGVRLLLRYPELLRLQLRVLLRLSRELELRLLIPMVAVPEDVAQVRTEMDRVAAELSLSRVPELGAMVETPAAALNVRALLEHADFINIGTNDLTQYSLAADRENVLVADYFRHDHEVIFWLLHLETSDAGSRQVGVCGELAGQLDAFPRLLQAGVRMLSVAPALIPSVKEAVRTCTASGSNPGAESEKS
ncbi:MAG TPA: phosphoenolpyruvate--protein phosphotransferase [Opitutaceae bacterium]